MKTGEKLYYVATETGKFMKGDVITRKSNDSLVNLTEDSNLTLFGTDFVNAQKYMYNNPKVTLIEVFADVQDDGIDDVEDVFVISVLDINILYDNALEIVDDKISENTLAELV